MAFGRPIGSFQAIKHMLADMYVAATLARSNCYFGAWALSAGSNKLSEAAAIARVSSTKAFQLCSRNNIPTHGGMGYTWEFDCHLFIVKVLMLLCVIGLAIFSFVGPETLPQTAIHTDDAPGHGFSHAEIIKPTPYFLEIIFSSH